MRLLHISIVCITSFFFGVSQASTISLNPLDPTPTLGQQVSIELSMDFSDDPTLGGGVDIQYSGTQLDFLSFTFDAGFLTITDPLTTCPGAAGCSSIDQPNTVFNIAFGNFSGIGGPFLVGTVVFDTLAIGSISLMTAETTGSGGPFVPLSDPLSTQPVTYLGTSVDVSAVPIPAAGILFISGLFGLATFSRRTGGPKAIKT